MSNLISLNLLSKNILPKFLYNQFIPDFTSGKWQNRKPIFCIGQDDY
jgi:hypothetical protein